MRARRLFTAVLIILATSLFAEEHPNVARGFHADKAYSFGDVDAVNLFNGNLTLTVPIGPEYSGNGSLKYQFALHYNSKAWDRETYIYEYQPVCSQPPGSDLPVADPTCGHPYDLTMPSRSSNAGMGWSLSLGRLLSPNDPSLWGGSAGVTLPYWVYESPDGGQHNFFGSSEFSYTNDGSYLRLTPLHDAVGSYEVSFPDGIVQRFVPGPYYTYRLADMRDPFGNHLQVDYAANGDWTLTEYDAGNVHQIRQHKVKVHDTTVDPPAIKPKVTSHNYDNVISEIDLASFGASNSAVYTLQYTANPSTDGQFGVDPIYYGCFGDVRLGATPTFQQSDAYKVPRLHHVQLPDGSHWDATYFNAGCSEINQLALPTKGHIEWTWTVYSLPTSTCRTAQTVDVYTPDRMYASVDGVETKKLVNTDGTEYLWRYTQDLDRSNLWASFPCPGDESSLGLKSQEAITTVLSPDGLKTVNYFSIWDGGSSNFYDRRDYGLPFSRNPDSNCASTPTSSELCVSSRVFECPNGVCNSNPSRIRYVRYEGVIPSATGELWDAGYRTEAAEQTKYCENVGETDCHTEHHIDVVRSRWDGLGHYRRTDTSDSWTPATRAEVTEYNPDKTDVTINPVTWMSSATYWPNAAPPLLNLYNKSSVTSNGTTSTSLFCFEAANGFLSRKRTQAGLSPQTNDLLAVFDRDNNGNAIKERYFGGDSTPLDSTLDTCNGTVAAVAPYTMTHEYSGGSLKNTQYAGVNYKSLNLQVDSNSGLPSSSTDSAGVITNYNYDPQGRTTLEQPQGQARTTYEYRATDDPAAVIVRQFAHDANPASDPSITDRRFYFDGLGRVKETRTLMPDGWSVVRNIYDVFGRVLQTSMPEYRSTGSYESGFNPSHWQVFTYDGFGRVLTSTTPAPDSKVTSTSYAGIRQITRTQSIAMNGGTEKPVSRTESYDGFGRITAVSEFSGVGSNPDDSTTAVRTQYGYDIPDPSDATHSHSLMTVDTTDTTDTAHPHQYRAFQYDLRGFLSGEQSPERGLTQYPSYDARGHLLRKQDGSLTKYDLSYVYDAAEHLKTVTPFGSATPVKEFVFDPDLGRLNQAIRHNVTAALGDVQVSDTFSYDGAGRVSNKLTAITQNKNGTVTNGPIFTQGFTYTDLGRPDQFRFPTCTNCTANSNPNCGTACTIVPAYSYGILTGVAGFTTDNGVKYWPNGMIHQVVHLGKDSQHTTTDIQDEDASGLARPASIDFTGVCAGPTLAAPTPATVTVAAGQPADFSIAAPSGVTNPQYQWYKGARGVITNPVAGQTTRSLHISSVTETATYWVRVFGDDGCSTDSTTVTANVRICDTAALAITTQPKDIITPAGISVTFNVVVNDTTANYQWYEGVSGSTLKPVGTNSPTYATPPIVGPTSYWVRVFSSDHLCSVDSASARVTLCVPPLIQTQPSSQEGILNNGSVTLSTIVEASGTNLKYEWHEVTVNSDGTISGVRTVTSLDTTDPRRLTLRLTQTGTTTYRVRVYDDSSPAACRGDLWSAVFTFTAYDAGACVHIISGGGGDFTSTPVYNAFLFGVSAEGIGAPFKYEFFHGINGQVLPYNLDPDKSDFLVGPSGDYDAVWCVVSSKATTGPCAHASATTEKTYMKRWYACPLPPLTVTPMHINTPSQTSPEGKFTAYCDWPRVTYQWYYGSAGDTSRPIANATGKTVSIYPSATTTLWVRVTNECGTGHEDSSTLSYTFDGCDPVVITSHPQSVSIAAGDTPTLSAYAPNGEGYAWFIDGGEQLRDSLNNPLLGPSIVVPSKYTKQTQNIVALVQNSCSSVYSAPATVHVKSCGTLTITTQPQSQTLDPHAFPEGIDLSVAVSTNDVVHYKWYRGETGDTSQPIADSDHPTLHDVVSASAKYWVRISTDACSVDSNTAVMCTPAYFPTPTQATSYIRSGQVIFLQSNAGGDHLTYSWYVNSTSGEAVSHDAWYYAYPTQTTTYYLVVSGDCGQAAQAAMVVQVCQAPAITQQPQSVTVFPGKTTTLRITANEGPGTQISYQWSDETGAGVKAETLDSGVTSSYTTPPITAPKTYGVHLTTGACAADSNTATVSLCTLPEVIGGAAAYYVTPGQLVTLHASATMGDNTFQWYSGAVGDTTHPITDAINPSYAFVPPSTGGLYWCSVTHADDGCVSHTGVNTVNVCVPVISQQPANALRIPGSSVTLSVTASPASAYQWYVGQKGDITNPVAGATAASISVSPSTDTSYWVRVIGTCGKDDRGGDIAVTDSESALVTVCQPPSFQQAIPGTWWVARGASWTLGVVANGTSLTYQWYTGNSGDTSAPIANATGANLTVTPQNTTSYWVRVSGSCAPPANGPTMTVAVCMTPSITAQPQSVSIFSGSTTTLSVTATEATTSAMTYQWYRGLSGDDSVPISGATVSTFTTPALTADTNYWVRVSCGSCPPANSQTAAVTICLYPQTIAPPPDVQIGAGDLTRLTGVTQTPSGNSYKWYRGASGNTSSPISDWSPTIYYDVNPTVTTQYWYQLQNGSCTSNSGTVTVNVCIPRITTQPNSIIINSGSPTTLSVVATPTTNTYQWYVGTSGTTTSPISGATSSSFTVTPSSTTSYWVRITSACGRTLDSNTATVTICQLPAIQSAGPTGSDPHGTPYTLIVNATGTNITYQWYTGSTGNTAAPIAGATSSTLVVTPADTTNYWVRVSGACNPPKDSGTITVSVCGTPGINTQPQSVYIFSGASTTLSVSAGEGYNTPMTYQWYRGASGDPSNPIAGATSTTYTTPALTADTSYWVKVSAGSCNPANSQTAVVSMCANPQIVTSSGDVQTSYLQSTRLYAYGSGTGNSYTWYIGAAGDTSHPYYSSANNYMDVAPGTTTQYWAQVVNGTCTSRTNTITVSVCVPTFTTQPQSITIPQGSPTTLTSAANTAGVTYQWYVGASGTTSSPIAGATGSNLTVTPSATTNYWVRAIGSCGRTADSATATVTMCAPPAITAQPTDGSTAPYYWMSKTVQATGAGLTYQWYQGDSGDTHAPLSDSSRDYQATGTATATLNLYVQGAMKVWVRVTGQCGAINSNAVWFNVVPTLYQPQSRTVSSGSSGSLMVGASAGTSVISYQWYNGSTGAPIGGNSNIVTFTNITSAVSAYCKVMTGDIYVWSYSASIDVCHGPSVTLSQTVSGTYRYIYATVNGDYSAIEWYQGPVGQTNGSTYLQSGGNALWIPYSPGTIWCRVYGTDIYSGSECDADASVTLTP